MEREGVIFNLQKFSLNDGPGIRTVVFLKGCPLRCRWCSNPESQAPGIQRAAGKTEGCRRTVPSIVEECAQDRAFYEESGGGVTLSGGEPLFQPEFSLALLKALKEEGFHTALETTGFVDREVFRQAARHTDLFLFDIKHWDEERHRAGTGVSNALPLLNMKWALGAGKEVLPRLPVIPGYNDSLEDAAGFARRLGEAGASRVQLLPFHQFGESKYQLLGMEYAYRDVPALHEEDLQDFRKAFSKRGIDAFF